MKTGKRFGTGRKMCIQHATISTMLHRMEASGMIKKEKDETDKRTSRVYLTKNGRDALKHISKIWKQWKPL
jgi:DNA-binding MarR family transcriptional regulator